MLSVTNGPASRLHQAIIPSSQSHCTNSIVPPCGAHASYFPFYLQNILKVSLSAEKPRKQIHYIANNAVPWGV